MNWLGLHREYLGQGEMGIIVSLLNGIEAKSMTEFGCRDGRTARVLLHNVPTLERYIGLDVPRTYSPSLSHQLNEMVDEPGHFALSDPRFELRIRDFGTLDFVAHELEPCDAVFIDGDHSESVVSWDSDLARTIATKLIVWHDYTNAAVEVKRVLDRLHDDESWPIKSVEGTWLAFMLI